MKNNRLKSVKNNRLMDMILLQDWYDSVTINLMHAIDTHINSNQLKRKQSEKQKGLLKIKKKQEDWFYIAYCFGLWKQAFFSDAKWFSYKAMDHWLRFCSDDDAVTAHEALGETKKPYYNNGLIY